MSNLDYSSAPLYYRHTGQAPFASTTLAAIASWLIVTVLAAAYGWVDLHVKLFDIVSAIMCVGFALAMAAAVAFIISWAKVRNTAVATIIALSSALLALYVSWVSWEHAVWSEATGNAPPIWALFRRPQVVWELARDINQEGTFRLRNMEVKGAFLWVIWVVEAGVIAGCILMFPIQMIRNSTFCENCQRWCPKPVHILRVAFGDEDQLRENVEQKNFDYLASLPPADLDTPLHFHVELCACETCDEMNLLTVNRVAVGTDSKGNRQESITKVVNRLHVSADEAEELRELKNAAAAKRAAAGAATAEASNVAAADAPPSDSTPAAPSE